MKIQILEYKCHQGNNVKVQSHNFIEGKWVINPKFDMHKQIANQTGKYTAGFHPIVYKKMYSKEIKK